MAEITYPRIEQYGLVISNDKPGPPGIHWSEFLAKIPYEQKDRFSELMTGQTCSENGAYPWDVEAVLERMNSGRLTGTQLYWD